MTGVVFVFVREDASEAETLAEAFDEAGFTITGANLDPHALAIVIWSRNALRSRAFRAAAERAVRENKAIVACLSASPSRPAHGAPVVDLTGWDGDDTAALDPLFEIAERLVRPVRGNVIELPSRLAYEDAEFVELPEQEADLEAEWAARARRSWEAPIPSDMLRPVREEARPERLGARQPRRDFRRLHVVHPRSHAPLALATLALAGASMAALTIPIGPPRIQPERAAPAAAIESAPARVSLTSASSDAAGLADVAPVEPAPLFEPAPQIGRAGIEPPSARSTARRVVTQRRATRPARTDARVYRPPELIPDAIIADLDRDSVRLSEHGG